MRLWRPWFAVVLAGALAGCGDDGVRSDAVVDDAGVAHIHGLGINPADGALVIATHTGLFEAAAERTTATRIGDRRQDTMGSPWSGRIGSWAPAIPTPVTSCRRCSD